MNKYRKAVLFACVLCIVLSCLLNPVKVYADSAFQSGDLDEDDGHLIVSMVYDDSGSMEGEKGTYCNYTFQLFLSIFGEDDELFITYMSKPLTSANYSIHNNRQERINNLRAHGNKIFTPIASLETAYERLLYEEGDSSDSYWLLILTDGLFYDANDRTVTQEELDNYIGAYADTVLRNGHKINILYVGIGDEVMFPNVEAENLEILRVREPQEILGIMDACSEVFSECIKAENVKFVQMTTDEKEVHLTTTIPLEKVIVIEHNIEEYDEQTVGACDFSGNSLRTEEELEIYHTYVSYDTGQKNTLNGRVTYLSEEEDYIQDGLDLTFSYAVNPEEIMIYIKPAIELNIEYCNSEGKPVEIKDCSLKDILEARLIFRRLDTGEMIRTTELADNNINHISVTDGRRKMLLADGEEPVLFDISMVNEGMIVSGEAIFSIAGVYTKEDAISLYVSEIEDKAGYRFDRTKLAKNGEGFRYSVTKNNSALSRKKMVDFRVNFKTRLSKSLFHVDFTLKNDGTAEIVPSFGYNNLFGKLFVNWLCVWVIPDDRTDVTIYADDILSDLHLEDTFTVYFDRGPVFLEIWYYIYPFAVVLLIIGYTIKRRFKKKQTIYYLELVQKGNRLVASDERWKHHSMNSIRVFGHRVKWNWWNLIPYIANRSRCGQITVLASQPFWKGKKSVRLKLFGWEYFKPNFSKRPKAGEIEINTEEYKEETKERAKIRAVTVEAGEYIVVGRDKEYYIIHLGRDR